MPSWRLGEGVLDAAFVVVQTYIMPIAGVALFSVAALADQTGISLLVDHQGLASGLSQQLQGNKF